MPANPVTAPALTLAAVNNQITVDIGGQQYTVTVRRHDTLWHLSDAWLGDPHRWPEAAPNFVTAVPAARRLWPCRSRFRHHGRPPLWIATMPPVSLVGLSCA
jgi:hypothetical protein